MKKLFEKLHRFFNADYRLAVLDMTAGTRWIVEPGIDRIAYLKAENAKGRHILIQPLYQSGYLLADDIPLSLLRRHHQLNDGTWKPGRMVVETSPDNYQVWIHASHSMDLDEKRYWLKKLKSDPGADPFNRWGRCPGFRNRKQKYCDALGGYPLARLIWIDWRRQAHIPTPQSSNGKRKITVLSPLPLEGGVCLSLNIFRHHYDCGNESSTDFAYALALFRRGLSEDTVRTYLLEQRTDWKNHAGNKNREAYLKRTVCRAKRIIEST